MDIRDIINLKKNGQTLSRANIYSVIQNLQSISDAQIGAFLMAVLLKGMDGEETYNLTCAMRDSGEVMDNSYAGGTVIDKHSTGGVSDSVTPILVSVCSSLGLKAIKLSGRGLSHTGGTVDKLECIKGFRVELSIEEIKDIVKKCGAVISSQSAELAPADKILYALRDHTETVDSIALIASSIMSKKLAAGADVLLLDVKYGSGAFMKTAGDAVALAQAMVDIADRAGKKCGALITCMQQPLTAYVGSGLELLSAIRVLMGQTGGGLGDLITVTKEICAQILLLTNTVNTLIDGRILYDSTVKSGAALSKFKQIVKAQGGSTEFENDFTQIFNPPHKSVVISNKSGYVTDIDASLVGRAVLQLGGGRQNPGDNIDKNAGLEFYPVIGKKIKKGDVVANLYCSDAGKLRQANEIVLSAFSLGESKVLPPKLIYAYVGKDSVQYY